MVKEKDYNQSWRVSLAVFLFVFVLCFSQRVYCPYSWWGYKETSYWEKTEESDIKLLKGFKLSKNQKIIFDELTKVIKSNSKKDSVIFGFPYIKIYNVFLDNYNMVDNVPVLFYDVCASDFAKQTSRHLTEQEPDIVVWLDIPGCLSTHERAYTSGVQLGQREIIKWFSEVKDSDYILIGQINNLFVYKLNKNEIPLGYTYINNQSTINQTANNDEI